MAFTVSNFKSGLASGGGGARPALYEVSITNSHDTSLSFGPTTASTPSNASLLVKSASIPAANIAPLAVNYAGRAYNWSGFRTYDNWTVTVLNDEDFAVRNAIEVWMNKMNSHIDNKAVNPAGLFADMTVTHYGRDGTLITGAVWTFKNAFPVALGEIGLDWGSNDAIEEFSIDFAYDYWSHGIQTT